MVDLLHTNLQIPTVKKLDTNWIPTEYVLSSKRPGAECRQRLLVGGTEVILEEPVFGRTNRQLSDRELGNTWSLGLNSKTLGI